MPTKTLPAKNGRAKAGVRPVARKRAPVAKPTTTAPATKLAPANTAKIKVVREVLRAGLKLLAAMTDAQLLAVLTAVPSIKTGRLKGKKTSKAAEAAAAAPSA
jgi:hypothetical protein